MTKLSYRYAAFTDVGLRRSNNQDSAYAGHHLIALADGMGGAAAGDLASSQVLSLIKELDGPVEGDALELLGAAVAKANERLSELTRDDPAVEGMGTTLEALLWDGRKLAVAHIGDSRIYRLREGKLTQISQDHTFVQSLVDEGRITREEARVHPHRSLLLRALLGRDDCDPDLSWLQPMAGDRYLLCSDGLSDLVSDEAIANSLRGESIDVIATDLVRQALEAGGFDNVTVVISEFLPEDAPATPELSCDDGRPQIVGAISEAPRPRTFDALVDEAVPTATDPADDAMQRAFSPTENSDEEEARYAPQPPGRFGWLRWVVWPVAAIAILSAILWGGWYWAQQQYWVGDHNGNVTIFRGVQTKIGGVELSQVQQQTTIKVDDLDAFRKQQVESGIQARDLTDAERTVENLAAYAKSNSNDSTGVGAQPTAAPTSTPPTSSLPIPSTSPSSP